MSSLRRPLLLLAAILLVPLVPVLVLGLSFEDRITAWIEATPLSPAMRFSLIIALLGIDIFLPIPSSAVSTWGGGVLGVWPATLASTLGMTLGAAVGFGLARGFGGAFAHRFAGDRDLEQTAELSRRFGPVALVLTRALPILAEACVLLLGTSRLSWRQFFPPVIAGNLVVSLTYAACGAYFQDRDALPAAIIASGTIPLAIALFARRWLPGMSRPPSEDGSPPSRPDAESGTERAPH